MTSAKLIKLCNAAEQDGTSCGHEAFEYECEPCARRRSISRAKLELAEYLTPARARSYAALWAALDRIKEFPRGEELDAMGSVRVIAAAALATAEEK